MRNLIEELYYGNICPMDRKIVKGGEYSHLLHLLTRNEDNLSGTLTQAQQETFSKYKDCVSEINEANEVTVGQPQLVETLMVDTGMTVISNYFLLRKWE